MSMMSSFYPSCRAMASPSARFYIHVSGLHIATTRLIPALSFLLDGHCPSSRPQGRLGPSFLSSPHLTPLFTLRSPLKPELWALEFSFAFSSSLAPPSVK